MDRSRADGGVRVSRATTPAREPASTQEFAEATPRPWQRSGCRIKWRTVASDHICDSHGVGPDSDPVALVLYDPKRHAESFANAALIAAAVNEREGLLAEVEGLREALRNLLQDFTDTVSGNPFAFNSARVARTALSRGAK
jgi:hypothetical protein